MSKSQTVTKLAAIVMLLALGACSSDVKLDGTIKSNIDDAAGTDANTRTVTPVNVGRGGLTDPDSPLAKHNIYFDFDSYSIKPEHQGLLGQHPRYLQSHNQHEVLIQGNADEYGTGEYNLVLGQRHVRAVRRTPSSMGVSNSQMEAVSLGKERPQATGHDGDSWAQNRRVDIIH